MKWISVVSRRTLLLYTAVLFMIYLFYVVNAYLADEGEISIRKIFLESRPYVKFNFASLFGINLFKNGTNINILQEQSSAPTRRLPNALIIGVKKCGTRALLEFLRLHPKIKAARSEVHFFDRFYHRGFEWYRDRMPPTYPNQVTMEKSPSYWVTRSAPRRVFSMNPHVRLIAVVRDPVTRVVSDYTQSASKRPSVARFEDLAFINTTTNSGTPVSSVDATWGPVRLGIYSRPLKRWLRRFPRSSLLLVSGERLVLDPAGEIGKVQDFLGLKRMITSKHFYFNSTKGFPCLLKTKGGTPHCLGKNKGRNHPYIDPAAIEKLREFYRPYNERFYQLAGVDFGWP